MCIRDSPWTIDAENYAAKWVWDDSEFYTYTDSASGTYNKIGTPQFYIPQDVAINIVTSAHGCKHASLTHDVTCRVYSGSTTADFTAKYNSNNYSDYTIGNLSLYSSSPKLQFENRHYTAYRKLYIKSVKITYR